MHQDQELKIIVYHGTVLTYKNDGFLRYVSKGGRLSPAQRSHGGSGNSTPIWFRWWPGLLDIMEEPSILQLVISLVLKLQFVFLGKATRDPPSLRVLMLSYRWCSGYSLSFCYLVSDVVLNYSSGYGLVRIDVFNILRHMLSSLVYFFHN